MMSRKVFENWIFYKSKQSPRRPRNPQQESSTGKAKDVRRRKRNACCILRSFSVFRAGAGRAVGRVVRPGGHRNIGQFCSAGASVYEQPPCPAEGYIWTPGYWAWDADDADYYWVPGTWVLAPEVGFLWTPAWWGWSSGVYLFHEGFWGPHVGFYGGIVYGLGYFGHGYEGGRWDGGHFFYNRSVNNINVTNIHNVYNTTVINNTTVNRVSYNGPEEFRSVRGLKSSRLNVRDTSRPLLCKGSMSKSLALTRSNGLRLIRADLR